MFDGPAVLQLTVCSLQFTVYSWPSWADFYFFIFYFFLYVLVPRPIYLSGVSKSVWAREQPFQSIRQFLYTFPLGALGYEAESIRLVWGQDCGMQWREHRRLEMDTISLVALPLAETVGMIGTRYDRYQV